MSEGPEGTSVSRDSANSARRRSRDSPPRRSRRRWTSVSPPAQRIRNSVPGMGMRGCSSASKIDPISASGRWSTSAVRAAARRRSSRSRSSSSSSPPQYRPFAASARSRPASRARPTAFSSAIALPRSSGLRGYRRDAAGAPSDGPSPRRRPGEVQHLAGGGDQRLVADPLAGLQDLLEHLGGEFGLAGVDEMLAVVLHGEVEHFGTGGLGGLDG